METARRLPTDLKVLSEAERILSAIRPYLQSEGTTISLKDFVDGRLVVQISGACVGCALAGTDLGDLTETFKSEIPEIREVDYRNPQGLPVF